MIVTPGKLNQRAQLYHQLGSMIGAGVPLLKALDMVSRHPDVRASRRTIAQLMEYMKAGLTFSESMRRVHGWLPDFDVALLSVGEETGRLDQCFRLLSSYYALRAIIIRDTISGLLTTTATLHVFLLVFPLSVLVLFARGIFDNNYALCLPFLVQKAVVFGTLYAAVFGLVFACQGQRGESWRALVESFAGMIPMLGTARKYLTLSRLAAALEATTSSGVSIVSGWQLAAGASGSPRLKSIVSGWRQQLDSGITPAELVNREGYFPEMFANFYFTGEQSGKLDDSLKRLQEYYQDEGFRKMKTFTYVMNGTIYGVVVMLVAYNIIRFYTGYYSGIIQGI